MRNVHNAVFDTLYALGLETLVCDSTSLDPNNPNAWTVGLAAMAGVDSIHPLAGVCLIVTLHADGDHEIEVSGRNMPWGIGVERQFCRVLMGALTPY
jgi:hypothetical protein